MKALASTLCCLLFGATALADAWEFDGVVLPSERGVVTSQTDGVVNNIVHANSEKVLKGAPLVILDDTDAKLELNMTLARQKQAEARLAEAKAQANRQRELMDRGIAAEATANPSITNFKIAEADFDLAKSEVNAAEIGLDRTVIRAPISGVVANSSAAKGMFVEAKAGQPLGEVIVVDPVMVAYHVDYQTRLDVMAQAGVATVEALFERLTVAVSLPNGTVMRDGLSPERADVVLDEDGNLTVWVRVPNPNLIMRPGLKVLVTSKLTKAGVQN